MLHFSGGGGGGGGLTRKRHLPHSAQPRHTNDWAPRTRKRHQQEHRPQRPTERSDPTQHAKGRTGDCPGPCKETTTRRNVTRGGYSDRTVILESCVRHSAGWVLHSVMSPHCTLLRGTSCSTAKGAHGNATEELFVLILLLCGRVPLLGPG